MMLLFAFVSLALTTTTVICAIICIMNFDQGLKRIKESNNDAACESYYLQPGNRAPNQMHFLSRPPSRLTLA
jgi:hypothetical protein